MKTKTGFKLEKKITWVVERAEEKGYSGGTDYPIGFQEVDVT